jgi:hypothetical protein
MKTIPNIPADLENVEWNYEAAVGQLRRAKTHSEIREAEVRVRDTKRQMGDISEALARGANFVPNVIISDAPKP